MFVLKKEKKNFAKKLIKILKITFNYIIPVKLDKRVHCNEQPHCSLHYLRWTELR